MYEYKYFLNRGYFYYIGVERKWILLIKLDEVTLIDFVTECHGKMTLIVHVTLLSAEIPRGWSGHSSKQ